MSGQQHAPAALYPPRKDPVPILQEAGWVLGPVWTGEKSRPHRDSMPDRPACSQSLYRLSYPALNNNNNNNNNTVELHLSGLTGTAGHLDMQNSTNGYFRQSVYSLTNETLFGWRPSTFTADEDFGNSLFRWGNPFGCYYTQCVPAFNPFDHARFEVLEAITLYCTWSDNR